MLREEALELGCVELLRGLQGDLDPLVPELGRDPGRLRQAARVQKRTEAGAHGGCGDARRLHLRGHAAEPDPGTAGTANPH